MKNNDTLIFIGFENTLNNAKYGFTIHKEYTVNRYCTDGLMWVINNNNTIRLVPTICFCTLRDKKIADYLNLPLPLRSNH